MDKWWPSGCHSRLHTPHSCLRMAAAPEVADMRMCIPLSAPASIWSATHPSSIATALDHLRNKLNEIYLTYVCPASTTNIGPVWGPYGLRYGTHMFYLQTGSMWISDGKPSMEHGKPPMGLTLYSFCDCSFCDLWFRLCIHWTNVSQIWAE